MMNFHKEIYKDDFYSKRNVSTKYAAEKILELVDDLLPGITSAVDVGCGVGTWLSVLCDQGVSVVRGFDGPWVDQNLLEIPSELFTQYNLEDVISDKQSYDLAISLEVAEHLPESVADTFVDSLTGLSDFVLFSAAVPHQGGVNHNNEQWQSYWAEKFAARGYLATDPIRPRIWNDQEISIPYRQNIILYVKKTRIGEIDAAPEDIDCISRAHPELYMIRNSKSVMKSLHDLRVAVMEKIAKSQ